MEAKESKLIDIFTEGKRYFIPKYQRPYSWTKDNAEQLVDDIFNSFESNEKEYFIGSLICIKNEDNTFEIVDGQQRLTTISLILAQLKNLIHDERLRLALERRIFVHDEFSDNNQQPRLTLRSKENGFYINYILSGDKSYFPKNPTVVEQTFLDNFSTIEEFLKTKDQVVLKNIARYVLENVLVVFVQTENFASSFRLFNVLNSRGLPLTTGDLLKNRLFEAAESTNINEDLIESQWAKFESILGIEKIDKFLSLHVISEKLDRDRVVVKIIDNFSNELNTKYANRPDDFLNTLVRSAENYQAIIEYDLDNHDVRLDLLTLIELKSDEWIPAILAFRNRMSISRDFSEEQFAFFLKVLTKVYMHGWFKKLIKSKREMVIYSALVAINNHKSFNEIIDAICGHADNENFIKSLDEPLYEPRVSQINLVKSVLLRIDRDAQDSSVLKTYSGVISIEHILPQKSTNNYWMERFQLSEHQQWVHKLGNLTLLGMTKNSESQNFDFIKKKSIYLKSNHKVSFDITKDICQLDEWNMPNLVHRHEVLKSKLKQMWVVTEHKQIAD